MDDNFLQKILKDDIYKKLLNVFTTEQEFLEAGFFCDELENKINHDSPFNLYNSPIIKKETDAIIIQTGSFAPYHSGHFNNINLAKEYLLTKGYSNVQGIICPDHDQYVVNKVKDTKYHVENRISHIQDKYVKNNNWLSVDSWMGLSVNTSVNFTCTAATNTTNILIFSSSCNTSLFSSVDLPCYFSHL